jgi:excisionase family DNA binding protein
MKPHAARRKRNAAQKKRGAKGQGHKDKVMSSEYSGDERLLTKGEVAQLCRVAVRTVDRWLMAGKVGCHRTPSGRVLFRKRDVLTAVAREQASPRRRDR